MKFLAFLKENKAFLIFVAFLFIFRGAIADWHPVPTGSMKPTILEGDVVWENKLAYDLQIPFTDISLIRLGEPKRGDIIVFTSAAAKKRMIKRLVGLPGETIEVKNNQLFINGKISDYTHPKDQALEPKREIDKESGIYAMESRDDLKAHVVQVKPHHYANPLRNYPPQQQLGHPCVNDLNRPIKIPEDHYFVMGDNRDNSADSRCYGFIPRSEIRGHATSTVMSVITKKSWAIWNWRFRSERFFDALK
jgi:signal peptidase I